MTYGKLDAAFNQFLKDIDRDSVDNYADEAEFYQEVLYFALENAGTTVEYPSKSDIVPLDIKYGFSANNVDMDDILSRIDKMIEFIYGVAEDDFGYRVKGYDAATLLEYGQIDVRRSQVTVRGGYSGFIPYIVDVGYDRPTKLVKFIADNCIDDLKSILNSDDVQISKFGNVTFSI